MADAAISALFDEAQGHTLQNAKPKSEAWYAAIKARDFGYGNCGICGGEFQKTNGKAKYCQECRPIYKKLWAEKNAEELKERRKKDYQENKNIHAARSRGWYLKNKDKAIQSAAASRRKKMKENPELVRAYSRNLMRKRRESDIEGDRKYRREYVARRIKNDPIYALNARMGKAIRSALSCGKGGKHWEELVDYTVEELKIHLESQFLPGMTWENHGRGKNCWHIDHKIPLSAHNYEAPGDIDFKKAWALSNLQPLWEQDNLRKSNKLERGFQPSLALG